MTNSAASATWSEPSLRLGSMPVLFCSSVTSGNVYSRVQASECRVPGGDGLVSDSWRFKLLDRPENGSSDIVRAKLPGPPLGCQAATARVEYVVDTSGVIAVVRGDFGSALTRFVRVRRLVPQIMPQHAFVQRGRRRRKTLCRLRFSCNQVAIFVHPAQTGQDGPPHGRTTWNTVEQNIDFYSKLHHDAKLLTSAPLTRNVSPAQTVVEQAAVNHEPVQGRMGRGIEIAANNRRHVLRTGFVKTVSLGQLNAFFYEPNRRLSRAGR